MHDSVIYRALFQNKILMASQTNMDIVMILPSQMLSGCASQHSLVGECTVS